MSAFTPRFTITNTVTAALTAIERARGFLDAAKLSEEWIERMSQRALLLEAHHTTHIEGTQLTLDQAARLWAGGAVEGADRNDVREHGMDLTGWLEYFVQGLFVQMEEVKARGEIVIRRDVIAREYGLNQRQTLAVGALLEHGQLGIEEFEALVPGVHRRTLQRDLQGLVERGVAVSRGAARTVRYHLKGKHS